MTETSNAVNVYLDVNDITEHKFNDFLSNVRCLTYSHGEWIVFVETKRRCNGAKIFTFIVENKGIVLHGDVKFSEKFVTGATGKHVSDLRYWVDFAFNSFVESKKIRYSTNCVIFLGNDEGATYPRRVTSRSENTNFDESIKFCFELW